MRISTIGFIYHNLNKEISCVICLVDIIFYYRGAEARGEDGGCPRGQENGGHLCPGYQRSGR